MHATCIYARNLCLVEMVITGIKRISLQECATLHMGGNPKICQNYAGELHTHREFLPGNAFIIILAKNGLETYSWDTTPRDVSFRRGVGVPHRKGIRSCKLWGGGGGGWVYMYTLAGMRIELWHLYHMTIHGGHVGSNTRASGCLHLWVT